MSAAAALTSGPTSVVGLEAGAEAQRTRPLDQPLDQWLDDRRLDDDPRAGRAALARRPEGGPDDAIRREVEVGVTEHDDPVLAAELEADPLEPAGGQLGDPTTRRRVAGEADHRDIRVGHQRVADLGAGAGHEVDRAGREAGLDHQLDEQRGAQRRVARRLEHDGVAGHERGHHLPARDGDREVPGGDDPGHAERLANAHRPLVGQLRRGGVAEHPASLPCHQEGDVDPLLDVAAGLREHLAHLAGHGPGEALLVVGHERAEAVQDLAALRRRGGTPASERGAGGRHGVGDVGRGRDLEAADHLAGVGRVDRVERPAGRGVQPLPADEQPVERRLRGPGAGRARRRVRHLRPVRTPSRRSRRRPGTAWRGRSDPRAGGARGAASRRSAPRSPRSGVRARSRRR